jgi:glutathione S-transferase
MILIGQYDSPFTRRIAVTMHIYRMPFDRQPYSVFGDIGLVRLHNPLVRVPILVLDDKEILVDSNAILDHLDEAVGRKSRALIPDAGPERRRVLQLTMLAHGISEKVLHLFMERYYHDTTSRSHDWESRCSSQIETGLETLDAACKEHWFFGDRITHADIMAGCMISHLALRVPELWPAHKYKKLHEFAFRCEGNKNFVAARIAENETIPARSN